MPLDIRSLVADELAIPVDPRVAALAAAVAARHPGAIGVLFYGSCLREAVLDGLMLDFYLIVSDYAAAYATRWEAAANRLLPPNVYPIEAGGLAAKYAVLSLADLYRLCGPETDNPSVWARFAQPSRLAWARDGAAGDAIVAAVARAAPTLLWRADPFLPGTGRGTAAGGGGGVRRGGALVAAPLHHAPHGPPPRAGEELGVWRAAFALTYAAELRAERTGRAASVVDADPERYHRFTAPALAAVRGFGAAPRGWAGTRRRGKLLTLARLAKASATYAGGLDYLAWKINRHAGAGIAIRPWQRRWPILGALSLLPRLLRRGSVR